MYTHLFWIWSKASWEAVCMERWNECVSNKRKHKSQKLFLIWKNSQVAQLTWSEICACRFWISAFSAMFSLCKAYRGLNTETETGKRVSWNVHKRVLFPTGRCTLSSVSRHNERPTMCSTNSCWLMNQRNVSIRRSCRWSAVVPLPACSFLYWPRCSSQRLENPPDSSSATLSQPVWTEQELGEHTNQHWEWQHY